ncbi:MAG: hypothetical protein AAF628_24855 [Planctomycetota bacterium]
MAPIVGADWVGMIDVTAEPTVTTFIGLATTPADLLLPRGYGALLLGVVPPPFFLGTASPGTHALPIPNESVLLGAELFTQPPNAFAWCQ